MNGHVSVYDRVTLSSSLSLRRCGRFGASVSVLNYVTFDDLKKMFFFVCFEYSNKNTKVRANEEKKVENLIFGAQITFERITDVVISLFLLHFTLVGFCIKKTVKFLTPYTYG